MKGLTKCRKGQKTFNIASLGVIAIALVVAAVILGMGGTILEKIQGAQSDSSATVSNNDSLTWAGNNTAISFIQSRISTSTVVLYNNGTKVNKGSGTSANYTVTSTAITILNSSLGPKGVTGSDWLTSELNASYSYSYGGVAFNSSNSGLTGVATMSEFIPTIAIVAVAVIVIGLVMVMLGRRREV